MSFKAFVVELFSGRLIAVCGLALAFFSTVLLSAQTGFCQDIKEIKEIQEKEVGAATGKLPEGCWYTLESKHFLIHFNVGSQALAKRVAGIAEDVHARLTREIKWKPSGRTHIVLMDWHDSINGWATPLPRNTITIYPVGPGLAELELTHTDDWLRLLITHEYTHILTMDMVAGLPAVFRTIFGRSAATVPSAFVPQWILEGYAIYQETKQTRGGRIRGTYYDMVLRSAVLERKFNSISQAQCGIGTWPLAIHYIYGGMFFQYLADTFGEESLLRIYKSQSRMLSPVMPWYPGVLEQIGIFLYWMAEDPVSKNGLAIFRGRSYERLWHTWHNRLKKRYEAQRARIEKKPLTQSARLTKTGYQTGCPRFSPDGKHIAYISRSGDRYAQLRLMDADGSNDRLLYQGVVESLNWSPDGKHIAFTMLDFWRGTFFYSDLYVYDLEGGDVTRLTRGLRVRSPAWSPDGSRILFAVNTGAGRSGLALLDLTKKKDPVTYLTQSKDTSFYSGCAWSPDGAKIAYVRLAPGKLQQIYIAGPDGSEAVALTDGQVQDLAPAWSPDGKFLLFTSSRTEVYNIFAHSLDTGRTLQLTNVIGGAISPSLSPDGKLAFAGYSSSGWDIHTAPVDLAKAQEAEPHGKLLPEMEYEVARREYKVREYNALDTILPTAWVPFAGIPLSEIGVIVAGMDVLEKHRYVLQVGYNPYRDRPVLGLLYDYEGNKYRGVPVVMSFEAYRQPILFAELMKDQYGEYVDYWEDQVLTDVSLRATLWRSTETKLRVAPGYEYKRFTRVSHLEPGGTVPGEGKLSSIYLRALFDDAKFYHLGISPADGRSVSLEAKWASPNLGSDYLIESYTLRWSEYVSVPGAAHHVVMARAAGGVSVGEVIDKRSFFALGGIEDIMSASDNEFFALRGYKPNEFLGTRAAVATLEYRFPLTLIEGGPATKPVFWRKLSGYVFVDYGNAWSARFRSRDFKTGAGFGLRLGMDLFYRTMGTVGLDLGFAHGFDADEGIDMVYLTTTLAW